jgi:hypothetical protein
LQVAVVVAVVELKQAVAEQVVYVQQLLQQEAVVL